ncbi:disease resistance-like protein DSC1 isoform X1 [Tanacetum coccineum]
MAAMDEDDDSDVDLFGEETVEEKKAESHDLRENLNISPVHNLDTLILKNCLKLVYVYDTLRDLTSLATLDITGCDNVTPCQGANARRKQEWISSQHMVSI